MYFAGVGINLETRAERRRRPRTRVVITVHGLWLIQVERIVRKCSKVLVFRHRVDLRCRWLKEAAVGARGEGYGVDVGVEVACILNLEEVVERRDRLSRSCGTYCST